MSAPIETLTVHGPPTTAHIDFAALDEFAFSDGRGFPASYRQFVRHAGWARTFGLWLIYPPVLPGYADGLSGRGGNLTMRFRETYTDGRAEDFDWIIEPDGNWELPTTLRVFGWSENGDVLLWDTATRHRDGEFDVWESLRMNTLHRRGASLGEALVGLRERAGAVGMDVEPLSAALA